MGRVKTTNKSSTETNKVVTIKKKQEDKKSITASRVAEVRKQYANKDRIKCKPDRVRNTSVVKGKENIRNTIQDLRVRNTSLGRGKENMVEKQKEDGVRAAAHFVSDPKALRSILTNQGLTSANENLQRNSFFCGRQSFLLRDNSSLSHAQPIIQRSTSEYMQPSASKRHFEYMQQSASKRRLDSPNGALKLGWGILGRPSDAANRRPSFMCKDNIMRSTRSVLRSTSVIEHDTKVNLPEKCQLNYEENNISSSPVRSALVELILDDKAVIQKADSTAIEANCLDDSLPNVVSSKADESSGHIGIPPPSEPPIPDRPLRRRTAEFVSQYQDMSPDTVEAELRKAEEVIDETDRKKRALQKVQSMKQKQTVPTASTDISLPIKSDARLSMICEDEENETSPYMQSRRKKTFELKPNYNTPKIGSNSQRRRSAFKRLSEARINKSQEGADSTLSTVASGSDDTVFGLAGDDDMMINDCTDNTLTPLQQTMIAANTPPPVDTAKETLTKVLNVKTPKAVRPSHTTGAIQEDSPALEPTAADANVIFVNPPIQTPLHCRSTKKVFDKRDQLDRKQGTPKSGSENRPPKAESKSKKAKSSKGPTLPFDVSAETTQLTGDESTIGPANSTVINQEVQSMPMPPINLSPICLSSGRLTRSKSRQMREIIENTPENRRPALISQCDQEIVNFLGLSTLQIGGTPKGRPTDPVASTLTDGTDQLFKPINEAKIYKENL